MAIWGLLSWIAASAALILAAGFGLFRWLYVRVPANLAFIRTGLGGSKPVADAGAFVLPIVHNIQWLSLETFKIEILRDKREAFITRDRYRVDIGAEFYVKILPEPAMIEAASRSLGDRSFSSEGILGLLGEKLISAMRSVVAEMELVALHENRRGFAQFVLETVSEPLAQNGLGVEDVAIFHLDQTDKTHLDPSNIFDAEGLRQITAQTSVRSQERNEIERNTEVEIKRKDVEAVRLKLDLDREQAFAEAEQRRQIDAFRFDQQRETRESELQNEVRVIEGERDRELANIERQRAIESAQQQRLETQAERERAEQAVRTVSETAAAERDKQVALIRAAHELEVAGQRVGAMERMAEGRLRKGEAKAKVRELLRRAENLTEPKLIYRQVAMQLIEKMPEIARELMEPARHIDSIRVLDVNGLGGGAESGAGDGDPVRRVYSALLGTGAALPLLKELLSYAGESGMLDTLGEHLPGLSRKKPKD